MAVQLIPDFKTDANMSNKKILILPGDYIGSEIMAEAVKVLEVLKAEGEQIDAAIVDIHIRGEKAFAICEILQARGVPFVLTSGYANWPVPEKWEDRPRLAKPYKLADLEGAVRGLVASNEAARH